jgi:hypothetical protein
VKQVHSVCKHKVQNQNSKQLINNIVLELIINSNERRSFEAQRNNRNNYKPKCSNVSVRKHLMHIYTTIEP